MLFNFEKSYHPKWNDISLHEVRYLTDHNLLKMVQQYSLITPDYQLETIRVINKLDIMGDRNSAFSSRRNNCSM